MTSAVSKTAATSQTGSDGLLLSGIVLAALTEAIASTILSLGRSDIIGDIHATPDEFAWLDVGYIAFKLIGFMVTPFLISRTRPQNLIIVAVMTMGIASAVAVMTNHLDTLVAMRAAQGLSGGILLVAGQSLIFLVFSSRSQSFLQALFAMGSVVAPATIAPALQGWLIDNGSWTWIFFGMVPIAMSAAGLLIAADIRPVSRAESMPPDWIGFLLAAIALASVTYVLTQGSRWNWFAQPHIIWMSTIGLSALAAYVVRQIAVGDKAVASFSVFESADFSFAFAVSFVAGAALFGSAFLIPSFAVSVLAFTPTAAGQLLLPSGGLFVLSLLIAAYVIQHRGAPPIATVPFGIVMVMCAMWTLSGSSVESGAHDMMPAILLRGFGLGFLFLSITLVAFGTLAPTRIPTGIALFNVGRQLGGLMGVAGLQTLIDHKAANTAAALGAHLVSGEPALHGRLSILTSALMAKGMDTAAANNAAIAILAKIVHQQSIVIAFNTAFIVVALLFVVAAPVLVTTKILTARRSSRIATNAGSD